MLEQCEAFAAAADICREMEAALHRAQAFAEAFGCFAHEKTVANCLRTLASQQIGTGVKNSRWTVTHRCLSYAHERLGGNSDRTQHAHSARCAVSTALQFLPRARA